MTIDFTPLDNASRLNVEAELKAAMGGGGRFQPTGFPDLGPALYKDAQGNDWLLVESPQSMANRLELACWDEAAECYDEICSGIPFIRSNVFVSGEMTATSTVQESHRLASPYILDGELLSNGSGSNLGVRKLWEILKSDDEDLGLALQDNRPFRLRNHAPRLFRIDPGCLLHGVWLSTKVEGSGRNRKALCGGKIRFPRILSSHIEAKNPRQANFGGVKRERIFDQAEAGSIDAQSGFGSIPFPRTDFTSPEIKAYFSIDLQLLRTCGLGEREERQDGNNKRRIPIDQKLNGQGDFTNEEAFIILWSIYKINRFLEAGTTLRSGCTFEKKLDVVSSPSGFPWPGSEELIAGLSKLRQSLFPLRDQGDEWHKRRVAVVTWNGSLPAVPNDGVSQPDNLSALGNPETGTDQQE